MTPPRRGFERFKDVAEDMLRRMVLGYTTKDVNTLASALQKAYEEGLADMKDKILRIGDDHKPEREDIHPQLAWFLVVVRKILIEEK